MKNSTREKKIWWHKSRKDYRYWLHWGKTCWYFELNLGKKCFSSHIGFEVGGDENDIMFHIGIYHLFSMYFIVKNFLPRRFMNQYFPETRMYQIRFNKDSICIDFHFDDYGYSKKWRGYHKYINWKDLLFGKLTYTQDELFTQELSLNLPEGDFDVILKAIECKRTRKRLLRPRRESRFEITPKTLTSEPGQKENYDLQFIDVVASTIEEALEKTIQIITDQNKK